MIWDAITSNPGLLFVAAVILAIAVRVVVKRRKAGR